SALLSAIAYSHSGSGNIVNLHSLGISLNNDGTLSVNQGALATNLSGHYSDVQNFLQSSTTGFAQNLSAVLNNLTDSTAGPLGLVLSLYDTILRDFRRADTAMNKGDVETRVSELNHALVVIAHLQSVLDFERGADAAKHFNSFYEITRGMILTVNVDANRETLH